MTQTSSAQPNNKADYAQDYLTWKHWAPEDFGALSPTDKKSFSAEIKRTGKTLPPGAAILEIGFGNGNFLSFAKQNGWQIRGTEMNPHLVETARLNGFDVQCTNSLSSYPDASFDLVAAFHVLEHIPQDEILNFLAEIKRILKPSGYFIAIFPNGDSPFGLANQNGDVTHVTAIGSGKVQYFTSELAVDLTYCGAEADIIHIENNPRQTIRNALAFAVKAGINLVVRAAFSQHNFASRNLVFIFRKRN